ADGVWDVNDRLLGRVRHSGALAAGGSDTFTLQADLPPVTPGTYHVIVRTDIFNDVYETNRANNTKASADLIEVQAQELHLGVPLDAALSTGQEQIYQVRVGLGQTLRVALTAGSADSAHELFLRYGEAPTPTTYDAVYQGGLAADAAATVP